MKKLSKRFISVFIALTVVFSTLAINGFAASATIVASTASKDYYQEDTFNVVISFPELCKKFATLDLTLDYDTNNYEFVSAKLGKGLEDARRLSDQRNYVNTFFSNYNKPGSLEWVLVSSRNYEITGEFATATFKVKKSAINGKSPIKLTVKEAIGVNNDSSDKRHSDVRSYITVKDADINIIRNIMADMRFTFNSKKKECTITQYSSTNSSEIIIPETHNGYKIVGIDSNVFANHAEIKTVVLPETITEIGDRAFSGCINLSDLQLPYSLKKIGEEAFKSCGKLESFIAPLNLESIGEAAFESCYRLKSLELNSKLKSIGESAFSGCQPLESVRISKNTTSIGKNAFSNSLLTINFLTVADNATVTNVIARDRILATVTPVIDINTATLTPIATQQYNPEGATPDVVLKYDGNKLENGKDYRVLYFDNKTADAKATAVIIGMGEYGETLTTTFDVKCTHEWNKVISSNPTCTAKGAYLCTCIHCGNTKKEVIPAKGHTESEVTNIFVRPTIYQEGDAFKICSVCSDKVGDRIPVAKIFPDVTGDGKVNSNDALEILKFIVELDSTLKGNEKNQFNADTNGDGKINSLDALDVLNITVGKIVL